MLLIGDIHITTKRADQIVTQLRDYISTKSDETIVFLGDYVYHFNYDRKALLKLYQLFIDLYAEGKHVYVLAGNHDRLQGNFVYEEAKKAFDLLANSQGSQMGVLKFITEPQWIDIEGKLCLFFPYHLPKQETYTTEKYAHLLSSDHQQEQWSGRANSLLTDMLTEKVSEDDVFVFHHRYLAKTAFPGQFAKFSFKSPALSEEFLDMKNIRMISGHLHQPFSYKNYLCLGSVRHTSPLEVNQHKFCFSLDMKTGTVQADHVQINPYLKIDATKEDGTLFEEGESGAKILDMRVLESHFSTTYMSGIEHIQTSEQWDVACGERQSASRKDITVTIQTDQGYHDMDLLIQPEARSLLRDVKLKQKTKSLPQLVQMMDTSAKNLDTRIGDWKGLLTSYIQQKYADGADEYFEVLDELGVMK